MIWVALTEFSSAPTTENHMDKTTQHDVETAVLSYRGYVGLEKRRVSLYIRTAVT